MNYSVSEENYIKAIYNLNGNKQPVSTNALAETLDTKPASVTDMLKKLKAKKLIVYQPYQGCRLSAEGVKVALNIVRRHRLWEYFLAEKLKFEWNEVHAVAEELEHVSSPKLIERLDEYLGFPRFDPHGDPIPDHEGKMQTLKQVKLTQLPLHTPAKVSGLTDQSTDMLELLRHRRISIGTAVEINRKFGFDHSVEIKIQDNPLFIISEQAAQHILVHHE
ncbi:iron-dependent repressor [Terrimonas sp.]|uniref:metal-dependent transcriptional regulator n=1 Tax=Terrimonas sp. TaxID=1914338 RepID=UPI000D517765|nr:metal-dependent transcriptional regulator [Terrimonas sp.]PVD53317.1 iron-dependent repressor [Terrimonas sp.]